MFSFSPAFTNGRLRRVFDISHLFTLIRNVLWTFRLEKSTVQEGKKTSNSRENQSSQAAPIKWQVLKSLILTTPPTFRANKPIIIVTNDDHRLSEGGLRIED
jgi:hypothetical protein